MTVSWSRGSFLVGVTATRRKTGLSAETEKKAARKIYDPSDRALFKAARKADRPGRLAGKGAGMCGRTGCPGSEKYRAKAFFRTAVIDGKQNRRGRLDVKAAALDAGGESPAVVSYYLYLTTLYDKREGVCEACRRAGGEIYTRYPEEWRIAWLMLFLSHEINRSTYRKWQFCRNSSRKAA